VKADIKMEADITASEIDRMDYLKKLQKEERKKQKQQAKEQETPEEKSERRRLKKEKKNDKREKQNASFEDAPSKDLCAENASTGVEMKLVSDTMIINEKVTDVEDVVDTQLEDPLPPSKAVEIKEEETKPFETDEPNIFVDEKKLKRRQKEELKKEKELAKAEESPEQKAERRRLKKEKKNNKRREKENISTQNISVENEAVDVEVGPLVNCPVITEEITNDQDFDEKASTNIEKADDVGRGEVNETTKVETEETEEYINGLLHKIRRTASVKTIVTEQVLPLTDPFSYPSQSDAETSKKKLEEMTSPPEKTSEFQPKVVCKAPSGKRVHGELTYNEDGTYSIEINASESGMYLVDVRNNGVKVPGSPFKVNIVQAADSKKIMLHTKGLRSGLLEDFRGEFHIDTTGAGPGHLKVCVKGPKNNFNIKMSRDLSERIVRVNLYPTMAGFYTIQVFWSGDHVKGSPVDIFLANDENELNYWLSPPPEIFGITVNDNGLRHHEFLRDKSLYD